MVSIEFDSSTLKIASYFPFPALMVGKPANEKMRSIRSRKVVMVGEASVGKTSIIGKLQYDAFDPHYQATIGIDFVPRVMHPTPDVSVKLQVWDTAGQERFRSLIPSYLRDQAASVVVYDVSNRASFEQVHSWVEKVKAEKDKPLIFLVGNKKDLENERKVSSDEGKTMAEKNGCHFMEVSAKTGAGVTELFNEIALEIQKENKEPAAESQGEIVLEAAKDTKKTSKGCSSQAC